jgi:hypothetical protein|tara:strand:+ start:356 stop:706 length:351 start_codon:yes stop_codon:yes gene_type:complete
MTVSTTDIANRALTRLGIKTFDNAVDAGIYEQITTSLTDLYEELYAVGTIDWQLNSIPAAAVGSFVNELCWYVRDDFAIPEAKKASLQVAQRTARGQLETITETPDDGEPTESDSF